MKWLDRFLGRRNAVSLEGRMYQSVCTLFSGDGKRSAEIRRLDDGKTYILECEAGDDGVFVARYAGTLVGPFRSPTHAERFIAATTWVAGRD